MGAAVSRLETLRRHVSACASTALITFVFLVRDYGPGPIRRAVLRMEEATGIPASVKLFTGWSHIKAVYQSHMLATYPTLAQGDDISKAVITELATSGARSALPFADACTSASRVTVLNFGSCS